MCGEFPAQSYVCVCGELPPQTFARWPTPGPTLGRTHWFMNWLAAGDAVEEGWKMSRGGGGGRPWQNDRNVENGMKA